MFFLSVVAYIYIYIYMCVCVCNIHISANNYIVASESTNKILRFANIGTSYKDTMESIAKKSMRRHKKIHCRPYHKNKQ